VWSPDGNTIAFYSERDRGSLWASRVGVIGNETLLMESPIGPAPDDWSRDGLYLVYEYKGDVWALPYPVSADSKPLRVTATPFTEGNARLSPDGRWVAYHSNQSGQLEVYIQSFPQPGIRQQVSTAGGQEPRWSADGKHLFYVTPDFTLMSVPTAPTPSSPGAGIPMRLFQTRMAIGGIGRNYSVAADGRFLINVTTTNQVADPITVVLNWFGELKARAPAR
jgi:Tol biopolymer transport system component